jgi:3-oxoacyl-[acyl-carrier protein] reductase
MAMALVAAGARVAMVDIDELSLAQTVAEVREAGGTDCAVPIVGNVSWPGDAEGVIEQTIAKLGGLHILVNNAGINPRFGSFAEITTEAWMQAFAVNVNGPFFMARAAVGHLVAQGWGRIIGVTTSLDTMTRSAPYGPTKAAHEAFIAVMARKLEGSGVTANVLIPGGAADTHMVPDADRSRLLRPEIMQAPVAWLASSASDGFSGQRVNARDWDEQLPIGDRVAKASAPAAWAQLGRSRRE